MVSYRMMYFGFLLNPKLPATPSAVSILLNSKAQILEPSLPIAEATNSRGGAVLSRTSAEA